MTPRAIRLSLLCAAFAAGLGAMVGAVLLLGNRIPAPLIAAASGVGGPFRLTDQDGKVVTDADLKGRPFLVFFGFTHCPDVCPTTLFEVSEVLRQLGSDADKTRALFVTVDPERDTPETLKDYLSSFDPHLMGLTGSPGAIEQALKAYRVYSRKVPADNGGYTMDHTTLVYLMDKQGRFVGRFNLKRPATEAAADLRRYL
jgi:protein SCO1/2